MILMTQIGLLNVVCKREGMILMTQTGLLNVVNQIKEVG